MRHISAILLFFLFSICHAQDFSIKGTLSDVESGVPLESATVFAERVQDSTLVTYTISDQNGKFELVGFSGEKALNVNISFIGYEPFLKKVELANRNIDLGAIKMNPATERLDGVTVIAARAPITIKKDTLEFNAASFKTKKGANVEDLLKELPGVEVDAEGKITVNGKPVNNVLVNGKPFFGDDPTIATRNLTKDIVDKIQVTDTKTDSQEFTGEAGDSENKTINITIDEDKNKGIFGRVAAGAGTDKRFEYAGLLNYFDNDRQVSVLGGGNNINSAGFSFGEINKMFGNSRYNSFSSNGSFNVGGRAFGGSEGITNSRVAGANYADTFGKETELSADYFYSAANTFNDELRNRENILPTNRYFSNTVSSSRNNTDSHSVNARFKTEIDSTFQINVRPQFGYTIGDAIFTIDEESRALDGTLTNQSSTNRISDSERKTFNNDLTVTKRYGGKGGFVKLEVDNDIEKDVNNTRLLSNTLIFGDDPNQIERNQITNGNQQSNQYTISTSFRYPIIEKKLFIDAEYQYQIDERDDVQTVFDFDETTQQFSDFNLEQSTDFENTDESSKPELGLSYNDEKLRATFKTAYVFRNLKSSDALRDVAFDNDFDALELTARLNYSFTKKMSVYSSYRLDNRAPTVSQLSPYIDVSNPLNIKQGNPDLKPTNEHSLYAGLNNYDYQTRSGFYSNLNARFTNDEVVAQTVVDENFVRNTTFTNVDGSYNLGIGFGYSKDKKLDSLQTFKYEIGAYINSSKSINFNNETQYSSRTERYSPRIGFTYLYTDLFEIRPSYNISYSRNTFDLAIFEDREYLAHNARLRTTLTYPKNLEWSNDVLYNYNPDVAAGFQRSSVFWNSTLAYSILNDSAIITLKAYDLLNQNTNAQRSSTEDYIQDSQSTVLQRYFLLSFSYKFNTLGKKGETGDDNFWWN